MRANRSGGRATVAVAGLAGLAALFVVVVTKGPLRPVERVFLVVGVALLVLGVTMGSRLSRTRRPRLMDGRFEGDDERDAAVGRDGRGGVEDDEPVLGTPTEEVR